MPSVMQKEAKMIEADIDKAEHKDRPAPEKVEKKKGGVTVSVRKR